MAKGAIGVFDSGYGGLTVLKEIVRRMPEYDYIYLADNARAPYGNRSFDTVYRFTLEGVRCLFDMGCPLVILACNTASAKALRNIQQNYLPTRADGRRVLGVIRPTTEMIGTVTRTRHIGILGTAGTVRSGSYPLEVTKFFPNVAVHQKECPMFVPLIENGEAESPAADYFVEKYLGGFLKDFPRMDALVLGCTHYPLLKSKMQRFLERIGRADVRLISQDGIVGASLKDYLDRHFEIERNISRGGEIRFYTTDSPEAFDRNAGSFFAGPVHSSQLEF